jgi:hypothetical protein
VKGTVTGWVGIVRWVNNGRIEAVGVYDTEDDARAALGAWHPKVEILTVQRIEIPYEVKP